MDALSFTLNGEPVEVRGVSPLTTLLDWLRASGRTGTKEGCAEGDCGACSVAVVERDAAGQPRYRAINSCLTLLPMVAGRALVTVEGVSPCGGPLHPVQQAMVSAYGSQCGYCTPGFVMSMLEGFHRDDCASPEAIDEQLCGNLCRCTGYRPIREAAARAIGGSAAGPGAGARALAIGDGAGGPLPELAYADADGGVRFYRPRTLGRLFAILGEEPEARLVAGATDLGIEVTKQHRRPPVLVSTEAVEEMGELSRIGEGAGEAWRVGAAVPLTRLHEAIGATLPALDAMLRVFGSRQIRNRATLGGNLATASPIGDLAPVLLALDARLVLASATGEREVPLAAFFLAYRKTALASGEVIRAAIIPSAPSAPGLVRVSASYKASKRREMDISIVSAAYTLDLDDEGIVRHARLAYGGVAATPARAVAVEAALVGRRWSGEAVESVKPILEAAFAPISDHRGSAGYRRKLVVNLLRRFAWEHPAAAPAGVAGGR